MNTFTDFVEKKVFDIQTKYQQNESKGSQSFSSLSQKSGTSNSPQLSFPIQETSEGHFSKGWCYELQGELDKLKQNLPRLCKGIATIVQASGIVEHCGLFKPPLSHPIQETSEGHLSKGWCVELQGEIKIRSPPLISSSIAAIAGASAVAGNCGLFKLFMSHENKDISNGNERIQSLNKCDDISSIERAPSTPYNSDSLFEVTVTFDFDQTKTVIRNIGNSFRYIYIWFIFLFCCIQCSIMKLICMMFIAHAIHHLEYSFFFKHEHETQILLMACVTFIFYIISFIYKCTMPGIVFPLSQ